MRMVIGICILVDGYPLIFFFRETLKLAPGSTAFTAAVFAFGLLLMVPFTIFRKLYRPNIRMFWMGISFLILCMVYMFTYNAVPGYNEYDKDMIYYTYAFVFLFLLINIPNDIVRVFIPVVVLFTLFSNLGLIYSLITNPYWAIGQRAVITLGDDDSGGNPHVFARNAYMGVVACVVWLTQPNTNIIYRLFSLISLLISIAVLVLAQSRSAILSLLMAIVLFLAFNVRPAQIRTAIRGFFKPISLSVLAVVILIIVFFFQRYSDVYTVLESYILAFIDRNLENVYAVLGLKSAGADYKATLDDSAANRSASANFFSNVLIGHLHMLILGYGYKFLYLDVPVLESLTNLGLLGFYLFGGVVFMSLYYSLGVMRRNPNSLSLFLAYFYLNIFVAAFTTGRPYDIWFWIPFALMIRFMGIDHLFPKKLQEPELSDNYVLNPAAVQS